MTIADDMISNISLLIGLPKKVVNELIDKMNLCIGSAIHDAVKNNDSAIIINVGIGNLGIDLSTMQCKFIPSKDLKAAIKTSLESEVDPLELKLEEALIERLVAVCEEEI